ncbi:MAG TPA: hypothetical protein VF980_09360 [Thermoanaerobaculia bacterium]
MRLIRVRLAFFPRAEAFDDEARDVERLAEDFLPPLRPAAERRAGVERLDPPRFELLARRFELFFEPPLRDERRFDDGLFFVDLDDFLEELRDPRFFDDFFEDLEDRFFDAAMFFLLLKCRCGEPCRDQESRCARRVVYALHRDNLDEHVAIVTRGRAALDAGDRDAAVRRDRSVLHLPRAAQSPHHARARRRQLARADDLHVRGGRT